MIASLKQHKGNTSPIISLIAIQNYRYFDISFNFSNKSLLTNLLKTNFYTIFVSFRVRMRVELVLGV